jgi:hypothetical protein
MRQKEKIKYIKKLPSNYELMLISFFITNPQALIKLKKQWDKRDAEHKNYKGRTKKDYKAVSSETFGGSIALIDPNNLKLGFISEISCPVATGMYYDNKNKKLFVGSNKWVKVIKGGKIITSLGNNLFNDIHSISVSPQKNLLICSTGTDSILEINPNNPSKILWAWFATKNGYKQTPSGKIRKINKKLNYQIITTTTPEHTTHINSCWNYKKNKILATLFHQGTIIEININTKKSIILFSGLKCPHFIKKRKNGYLVSDTRNNRVLLLNKKFKIKKIFKNNYNWVQDAVELKNGHFIIGDSNNERIVKVNQDGKKIEKFQMKKNSRKLFSFLKITKKEAAEIFGL